MNLKKKLSIGFVVIIAVALVLLILPYYSKNKVFYCRYDPETQSYLYWLQKRGSFNQALEEARRNNEPWTGSPEGIALHLAGYPNPDGTSPDKVDVFKTGGRTASIIIFDDNLADDAFSTEETRVDLVEKKGKWEIEWAGVRWKCRRTLYTGWTTSGCS